MNAPAWIAPLWLAAGHFGQVALDAVVGILFGVVESAALLARSAWAHPDITAQGMLSLMVCVGCVCRLDLMSPTRNRLSARLFYFLVGVGAFGVFVDAIQRGESDWYDATLLIAMLLHMGTTHRAWKRAPPRDTRRGDL